MQKQAMINEMEKSSGILFATKKQVADWFGISDQHYISKYLHGVEAIDGKYYFIPEIAEVLKARARA